MPLCMFLIVNILSFEIGTMDRRIVSFKYLNTLFLTKVKRTKQKKLYLSLTKIIPSFFLFMFLCFLNSEAIEVIWWLV